MAAAAIGMALLGGLKIGAGLYQGQIQKAQYDRQAMLSRETSKVNAAQIDMANDANLEALRYAIARRKEY